MKAITDEQYAELRQLVIEAMQHEEELNTGAAMDLLNSLSELPERDGAVRCPDCNGTGVEHHPAYPTCPTCNGCGLVSEQEAKK
jgi:rubrerythrin